MVTPLLANQDVTPMLIGIRCEFSASFTTHRQLILNYIIIVILFLHEVYLQLTETLNIKSK